MALICFDCTLIKTTVQTFAGVKIPQKGFTQTCDFRKKQSFHALCAIPMNLAYLPVNVIGAKIYTLGLRKKICPPWWKIAECGHDQTSDDLQFNARGWRDFVPSLALFCYIY